MGMELPARLPNRAEREARPPEGLPSRPKRRGARELAPAGRAHVARGAQDKAVDPRFPMMRQEHGAVEERGGEPLDQRQRALGKKMPGDLGLGEPREPG